MHPPFQMGLVISGVERLRGKAATTARVRVAGPVYRLSRWFPTALTASPETHTFVSFDRGTANMVREPRAPHTYDHQ